jgi:hypothetical protein
MHSSWLFAQNSLRAAQGADSVRTLTIVAIRSRQFGRLEHDCAEMNAVSVA